VQAAGVLVGAVMKTTRGKADAAHGPAVRSASG
jgi:Asp-tRNA(Asn)/Glu-tRNA(Gln) amidotransferase B subunit